MGGYKEVLESAAKRIRSLERVQKGMLLFAAVLPLAFFAAYFMTTGREGFEYRNAILVPEAGADEGADGTAYAGTINGKPAVFTVSPDKTVEFRYGETICGPYTVKEDPSAIPKRGGDVKTLAELEDMRGIELYRGDELLFRGGARYFGNGYRLYNEEGEIEVLGPIMAGGKSLEESGNTADPMEPSAGVLLELMYGPVLLTHKGDWNGWLFGTLLCAAISVSVLFADELFRWNLRFRIRDPERAEPSEWEIAGRYLAWTVLLIWAVTVFIAGLQ